MALEYRTPAYEGPLDLLLALIQKAEVNIYDIPISVITDQFLDFIHKAGEVGLQDLSEFYKMAAELIWIKSQMMLPVEMEFDEQYTDPREELVERLLEYSRFKKYSQLLMGNEDTSSIMIQRKAVQFLLPFTDEELWEDVTTNDLLQTYIQMMKSLQAFNEKVINVYEEVTVNEKITLMNEMFEKNETIMFSDLLVRRNSPEHVICSFLAVLDAVKLKMIVIEQEEPFGDITITKRPQDWESEKADEYDEMAEEIEDNNLEDEDEYSIITNSND